MKCKYCGCTDDHACPGGCYWVEPNVCSRCPPFANAHMVNALFIGTTNNRGPKNRWQCPVCKDNPYTGESRFNLSKDNIDCTHNCRFCGTRLWLEMPK